VTLEHNLRRAGAWVPEVHAAILGSGKNPSGVWCERNGQHKVSMALKSLNALATFWGLAAVASGWVEFPHLDCPVQTSTDELLAIWRESNRVYGITVAVSTFQTLHKVAGMDIPDANALVERASSNIVGIRRDSNGSDTILDRERQRVRTLFDVPESYGSISTA
jgi:hypothetical protein